MEVEGEEQNHLVKFILLDSDCNASCILQLISNHDIYDLNSNYYDSHSHQHHNVYNLSPTSPSHEYSSSIINSSFSNRRQHLKKLPVGWFVNGILKGEPVLVKPVPFLLAKNMVDNSLF
jgi:hypothetical protein